jgi:hypothetical protein
MNTDLQMQLIATLDRLYDEHIASKASVDVRAFSVYCECCTEAIERFKVAMQQQIDAHKTVTKGE